MCSPALEPQSWLTTKEAARYLRTTVKTILRLVRSGRLHAYRLSGTKRHTFRFRREDLDASML